MVLIAHTLDEREAMGLRKQGWRFKSMSETMWELVWPDTKQWPPDPSDNSAIDTRD